MRKLALLLSLLILTGTAFTYCAEKVAIWDRYEIECRSQVEYENPLYDLKALRDAASNNEAFMQKMIRLFISQTEDGLKTVRESAENDDLDRVKSIIHQLKPSINTMVIDEIKEDIVRLIELAGERKNLDQLPDLISKIDNVLRSAIDQLRKNEVTPE